MSTWFTIQPAPGKALMKKKNENEIFSFRVRFLTLINTDLNTEMTNIVSIKQLGASRNILFTSVSAGNEHYVLCTLQQSSISAHKPNTDPVSVQACVCVCVSVLTGVKCSGQPSSCTHLRILFKCCKMFNQVTCAVKKSYSFLL